MKASRRAARAWLPAQRLWQFHNQLIDGSGLYESLKQIAISERYYRK